MLMSMQQQEAAMDRGNTYGWIFPVLIIGAAYFIFGSGGH